MRTVVSVPRGDHLPLRAARSSLLCVSLEVRTRRLEGTVAGRVISPISPCVCHPSKKGVCTHAGSGPGKQSAMSKRGQEATSSEGSPMAKPKPTVPAKTRPVNLLSPSPWSEGKSSAGFGTSDRLGDCRRKTRWSNKYKETRTDHPKSRNRMSSSEATGKSSKFKSWETGRQEVSSFSTSTRKLVRTATPRTKFQNRKYTNHQYMTKIFHFLKKKLGITAGWPGMGSPRHVLNRRRRTREIGSERKLLKWLQEHIEKLIMLNKRKRGSTRHACNCPLSMSASWFLVSTHLIWISESSVTAATMKLKSTVIGS